MLIYLMDNKNITFKVHTDDMRYLKRQVTNPASLYRDTGSRSGAAQWLPGSRSIGQKEFPFRFNKIWSGLLGLLLLLFIIICKAVGTRFIKVPA